MLESIMYYVFQLFSLKWIKLCLSFLFVSTTTFIGGLDKTVYALIVLMLIDFLLGLFQACRDNKCSASRLKEWLYKFILYGIAMIVWHFTDIIVFHDTIEYGFQNFIIVYLGVNEALSVIKHLTHYGVKFPAKLIESLEKFRDNESLIAKK